MTAADRQLIDWYFAQPGRSTSWDLAVGYLHNRAVSAKLARECQATLDQMRAERMRELGRRAESTP